MGDPVIMAGDPVIAARLLAEGCEALRRLRLVRGASWRTRRRIAAATAVVALALGLLGAAPLAEPAAALSVPSFAATSTTSCAGRALPRCVHFESVRRAPRHIASP